MRGEAEGAGLVQFGMEMTLGGTLWDAPVPMGHQQGDTVCTWNHTITEPLRL